VTTRVRIGEFRDLATIERPSETKNTVGMPDGWVEFAKVWVKYGPLSSRPREQVAGNVLESLVNVMVQCRFIEGVTPAMRIKFDQHVLNIKTVIDLDGRRQYLEMWCVEVE
jgi:SPP1 family predicted phage head-tail adaptor